jgi:RNA polymerase primary sigma factor
MARNAQLSDFDEGVPSYLGRLTQAPLLTPQQEEELAKQILAGSLASAGKLDELAVALRLPAGHDFSEFELRHIEREACTAKRRLIESNMRLVINIAKTYRNKAIPFEDLIQEGAIGLMQATERFDPSRGFRFSTYATHWIRQAIGRAIDNKSKAIRLPAHISQSLRRVERERLRLAKETGAEPSADQIAEAMGITTKKLMSIVQASQEMLSLDMTVGDSSGMTLGGILRDTQNADPEESMITEEMMTELRRIISELNEREQRVMSMRFRLDGTTDASLQDEIAREMKLSRERVRQIEVQAIKKLRVLAQRRRFREMFSQ